MAHRADSRSVRSSPWRSWRRPEVTRTSTTWPAAFRALRLADLAAATSSAADDPGHCQSSRAHRGERPERRPRRPTASSSCSCTSTPTGALAERRQSRVTPSSTCPVTALSRSGTRTRSAARASWSRRSRTLRAFPSTTTRGSTSTHVASLLDAIGGVTVTIPDTSTAFGQTFHKGANFLTGVLRPSTTPGTLRSADEDRTLRQEVIVREAWPRSADDHLLTNPVTMVSVLKAITSALTVDSNLTNSEVVSLSATTRRPERFRRHLRDRSHSDGARQARPEHGDRQSAMDGDQEGRHRGLRQAVPGDGDAASSALRIYLATKGVSGGLG